MISTQKIIISLLDKNGGFFSQFFSMLNHYLYAKHNNFIFCINSSNWMFKYDAGWNDYFEPNQFCKNIQDVQNVQNVQNIKHAKILQNFKLIEYIVALKELYVLKNDILIKADIEFKKLDLPSDFCSIFIRRGDKLISESEIVSVDKYLDRLLHIYPICKVIYLQTDDYSAYLELVECVKNKNLNIHICTLCDSNLHGVVMTTLHKHIIKNTNLKYSNVLNKTLCQKPTNELVGDEIKHHTEAMIIGLEIVLKSKYCVLDYQSNVSRFIKLMHPNFDNVQDIYGSVIDLQMESSPVFEFPKLLKDAYV